MAQNQMIRGEKLRMRPIIRKVLERFKSADSQQTKARMKHPSHCSVLHDVSAGAAHVVLLRPIRIEYRLGEPAPKAFQALQAS